MLLISVTQVGVVGCPEVRVILIPKVVENAQNQPNVWKIKQGRKIREKSCHDNKPSADPEKELLF